LAEVYVNEGIIPKKYSNDALHIAIATIYKMDAIVSWNLTHIVKFKTKFQVKNINKRLKEKDVIICIFVFQRKWFIKRRKILRRNTQNKRKNI
jgi:hypothetical protein